MTLAEPSTANPLPGLIAAEIAADGPIPVSRYMELCLTHPEHGYYKTRDPLGVSGDFTTAPEISQMFGELIGLWAVDTWRSHNEPEPFALVELGPGRGTLMADALRAAKLSPRFCAAAEVHLVETSPVLRASQAGLLSTSAVTPHWHDTLGTVPALPRITIANEFFDALPVEQFVRRDGYWHRRLVGLDENGSLAWELSPATAEHPSLAHFGAAEDGALAEIAPARSAVAERIAGAIVRDGGAALIIDYGHAETAVGDTLQAVRAHRQVDPLHRPGAVDLTTHVDFAALSRTASAAGAVVYGPMPMGDFLEALGIGHRAATLKRSAEPSMQAAIEAARHRLTAMSAMGSLFKVLVLADQAAPAPAPFELASWQAVP